MDAEEEKKLRKSLADALTNLSLVEDRIAAYVTDTDVPLKYVRVKEKLDQKIVDLKAKLGINGGGSVTPPGGIERRKSMIPWMVFIVGALVVGLVGGVASLSRPWVNPLPAELSDEHVVSIEMLTFTALAYSGQYSESVGEGFGTLSVANNHHSDQDYILKYSLPDEGSGYAGLTFVFTEPQDLSAYQFVEVVVSFEDEQAHCEMVLLDIYGNRQEFDLKQSTYSNSNISVTGDGKKRTITIPLKTVFDTVKLQFIEEIYFNAGTLHTRGEHTFIIHDVYFIK